MKFRFVLPILLVVGALAVGLAYTSAAQAGAAPLTANEELGKMLFFDANLSLNNNQACAACHAPEVGYTGPNEMINLHGGVYEGSIPGRFGNRKPPTAAYAGESPNLYYDAEEEVWVGGMFWDGRATGETLGDPLAEQAMGPFLNPAEQAVPDAQVMCAKVAASSYVGLYTAVWGALDCSDPVNVSAAYRNFARSIAAYERSSEVSAFTSPFDRFWDQAKSKGLDVTEISMSNWNKYKRLGLSNEELRGLAVFNTKAQCSACHTLEEGQAGYPLLTDFTYDNLGLPRNPENPASIADPSWADPGLGGYLQARGYPEAVTSTEVGKFKVPTLRNVDRRACGSTLVKAYGHNAYFKSLEAIVHYYNTRDVEVWPAPEVLANMNTLEVGDLKLNKTEEMWLVAFLKTLSDGSCK